MLRHIGHEISFVIKPGLFPTKKSEKFIGTGVLDLKSPYSFKIVNPKYLK